MTLDMERMELRLSAHSPNLIMRKLNRSKHLPNVLGTTPGNQASEAMPDHRN